MRKQRSVCALATVLAVAVSLAAGSALAVEVGEPAPEFTLPSMWDRDISLNDYRGSKLVLLQFYRTDFDPV